MIYGIEKPEPDDDFAVAIALWSTKEKSFMVTIMNPHITLSASFLKIVMTVHRQLYSLSTKKK